MSWRYIYISNADKMSLHLDNLNIEKENGEISIPLNEINTVLVDSYSTQLTVRLLARFAEYKIPLIVCDISMTPVGLYTNFTGHYRCYGIQKKQSLLSDEIKGKFYR